MAEQTGSCRNASTYLGELVTQVIHVPRPEPQIGPMLGSYAVEASPLSSYRQSSPSGSFSMDSRSIGGINVGTERGLCFKRFRVSTEKNAIAARAGQNCKRLHLSRLGGPDVLAPNQLGPYQTIHRFEPSFALVNTIAVTHYP